MALTYFKDGEWQVPGNLISVHSVLKDDTQSTSVARKSFTDVTGLSITMTPKSATNRVVVVAMLHGNNSQSANLALALRVLRDSTVLAEPASPGTNRTPSTASFYNSSSTNALIANVLAVFVDSPATTSSVTYKVQAGNIDNSTQTVHINRSRADADNNFYSRTVSSLTVFEVA